MEDWGKSKWYGWNVLFSLPFSQKMFWHITVGKAQMYLITFIVVQSIVEISHLQNYCGIAKRNYLTIVTLHVHCCAYILIIKNQALWGNGEGINIERLYSKHSDLWDSCCHDLVEHLNRVVPSLIRLAAMCFSPLWQIKMSGLKEELRAEQLYCQDSTSVRNVYESSLAHTQ